MRRNMDPELEKLMMEFATDYPVLPRAKPSEATHDKWVDDDDVTWWVHRWNPGCVEYGCAIHAPTDHDMSGWPKIMATGTIVVRLCKHNVEHPDPDSLNFFKRRGQEHMGVHKCDGCCKQRPKPRGGETMTMPSPKYIVPNGTTSITRNRHQAPDHDEWNCFICNPYGLDSNDIPNGS